MATILLEVNYTVAQNCAVFALDIPLIVPYEKKAHIQAVKLTTEGQFDYVKIISELIATPHGNSHLYSTLGPLFMTRRPNSAYYDNGFHFYVRPNIYNQLTFTFINERNAVLPLTSAMISIFIE